MMKITTPSPQNPQNKHDDDNNSMVRLVEVDSDDEDSDDKDDDVDDDTVQSVDCVTIGPVKNENEKLELANEGHKTTEVKPARVEDNSGNNDQEGNQANSNNEITPPRRYPACKRTQPDLLNPKAHKKSHRTKVAGVAHLNLQPAQVKLEYTDKEATIIGHFCDNIQFATRHQEIW